MLTIIVARARNGAIGRGNTIPWHAPEDLRAFRQETLGGAVIMGRRTWESLPLRPLPGRLNLVVSSGKADTPEVVRSIPEALRRAREAGVSRVYAIGGARIYAEALPIASRLLITEVDLVIEDADTFFPAFTDHEWLKTKETPLGGSGPRCVLTEYMRPAHLVSDLMSKPERFIRAERTLTSPTSPRPRRPVHHPKGDTGTC